MSTTSQATEAAFPPPPLEAIKQALLQVGCPHLIILFGSRARGDFGPHSDIDILIIEPSELPRYKRSARYRRALQGLYPAKDIVVWTPEEVEKWQHLPNTFIANALREGVTLYEH